MEQTERMEQSEKEQHIQQCREEYLRLLLGIQREGMDRLIAFIEKSDFFSAPSSTRFHCAYQGGLLIHSLNVYKCLKAKKENPVWAEALKDTDDESIALVSLLHDICKTYYYRVEKRNKKIDGVWTEVDDYVIDDRFPYGHGEKSVMMIEEFIKLRPAERYAIRWHMGPYTGQQDWNTLGDAMEKYPLVLALFEADMESCRIMEKS